MKIFKEMNTLQIVIFYNKIILQIYKTTLSIRIKNLQKTNLIYYRQKVLKVKNQMRNLKKKQEKNYQKDV